MLNETPVIPRNAPFSEDQRAWLNGFFAGIFSRKGKEEKPAVDPIPLTILFGTQTGTAESLAGQLAFESEKRGFKPSVFDMQDYPPEQLGTDKNLLILTSTYGNGAPPDNAQELVDYLHGEEAPSLEGVVFSVLGLGDSSYTKFCECAKVFDRRLEELGAKRLHPRTDCDVDYEEPFQSWMDGVLEAFAGLEPVPAATSNGSVPSNGTNGTVRKGPVAPKRAESGAAVTVAKPAKYTKDQPFSATLTISRNLNGEGSDKRTHHCVIRLKGSGIVHTPGDALGVIPRNCPELVEETLSCLPFDGEEVIVDKGIERTFHEALHKIYDLHHLKPSLVRAVAEKTGADSLRDLVSEEGHDGLSEYCATHEPVDLLSEFPDLGFSPDEFLSHLKRLQPRLYTIASSAKRFPDEVHLTVGVVEYETHGRRRKGVCSTFLADRVGPYGSIPVFLHTSKGFRLPKDGSTPIVMIGPGTGIAPFRAFLQERAEQGNRGKSWLFFGNPHRKTDFLYEEEIREFLDEGVLDRLELAFSRDQPEKIYVQDRMRENGEELFRWLEEGAHIYVCGDGKNMAPGVDQALREIIALHGHHSPEKAAEILSTMRKQGRYQRDVY